MWRVVTLVALAACGRYRFDAHTVDGASPGADARADGTADSPGDAAAAACLPSYLFCDGFEGAFMPLWTVDSGVTIDTAVSHRGASSVHFHSTALATGQQGYFRIFESQTLPPGDPVYYFRAWFKLGSLPAGTNGMELIAADQVGGPSFGDFLFLKNSRMQVYEQFDDQAQPTPSAPPLDTWLCVQWTLVRDTGPAGSINLAGDGGAAEITNVTTDGTPAISVLSLGIGYSGTNVAVAQPAMDVWMDDLIIDNAPITCAQ